MAPKEWPRLDLEKLTADEAHAIRVARAIIIRLENMPQGINRFLVNPRRDYPREVTLMNMVVARELKNKVSLKPEEILVQFGMTEEETAEALNPENHAFSIYTFVEEDLT